MTKFDVLVVGAGPAGSVAATVLARAGARVRVLDRAVFPRPKLCGDTVNPGTLAVLRRLHMAGQLETAGLRVDGMRITSEDGLTIDGRYPRGLCGRAIRRRDLDWLLLQQALAAGASFEPGVAVRRARVQTGGSQGVVEGVEVGSEKRPRLFSAPVTIAADGRRSVLAFGLQLTEHPRRPRRWAVGAYFDDAGAAPAATFGEMHIRQGRYVGVAPVPRGLVNVCLVKPFGAGKPIIGDPERLLRSELERDPWLGDRFVGARLACRPTVLGPLAVDAIPTRDPPAGLLLAGDAAGFIDPMTGDGLRFAVRGGELAAEAALRALEHGWSGVHEQLRAARRREFAAKWRLNRALRAIVASPTALGAATAGARLAPAIVRALIARAGDCNLS
jgi:flavin-dependent dehydrogenase